jgi:hypothetical protein
VPVPDPTPAPAPAPDWYATAQTVTGVPGNYGGQESQAFHFDTGSGAQLTLTLFPDGTAHWFTSYHTAVAQITTNKNGTSVNVQPLKPNRSA